MAILIELSSKERIQNSAPFFVLELDCSSNYIGRSFR